MKLSIDGLLSIIAFEGVILKTYSDSAGILTIGIGHTSMAGKPDPVPNMTLSLEDAVRLFQKDIEKYETQVLDEVTVPLSQNEFDALVSWHFNTGGIYSATLTELLNDNKREEAAKEFARWNKATVNGKKVVLKGLSRRRKRETEIFTKSDYGDEPITVDDGTSGGKRIWSKKDFASQLTQAHIQKEHQEPEAEEELSTAELLANPDSRFLPTWRPRQRDAVTRATIEKFAHLLPSDRRSDDVILLGIRGYYTDTMGKKGVNDRGLYDDAIFVVTPEEIINFNANTDPSAFRRRIASLKAPQAVRYKPGLHGYNRKNGPYPAFRQDSVCTVIRDRIGEDTDSAASRFWINLHRGGNKTTSSAGCQTIPPNQWTEFKHTVDQLLRTYGQKDFYYLLIDEEDKAMTVVTNEGHAPSIPAPHNSELSEIRASLAVLMARLDQISQSGGLAVPANQTRLPPPESPDPSPQTGSESPLISHLQSTLQAIEKAGGLKGKSSQEILQIVLGSIGGKPPLTPVNNALGPLIGNLLNGKKTVIGTVGLLATTLLPALGAVFPALAPLSLAAAKILPVATPILTALTGWGVLGKIDKYFATRT